MRYIGVLVMMSVAGCNFSDILEGRLGPVEDRVDSLDERADVVNERVDDVDEWAGTVDVQDLAATVAALEAEISGLKGDLNAMDVRATSLENNAPAMWLLEDTVWTVGKNQKYTDPLLAVQAAHLVRIVPGATLTLEIEPGEYNLTESLDFRHPDGGRVMLVGLGGGPTDVVLTFVGVGGVVVSDGYQLGGIDGLTLKGGGTQTNSMHGVYASTYGIARVGGDVVVTGFGGDGLHAFLGGFIHAGDLQLQNNGRFGANAQNGGVIWAEGSRSSDNVIGYYANLAGQMYVDESRSFNNIEGYTSARESVLSANGATAEDNAKVGFRANYSSTISAGSSVSQNNGTHGYYSHVQSLIYAQNAKAFNSNGIGFYSNFGSALMADSGKGEGNKTSSCVVNRNGWIWTNEATFDGECSVSGGFAWP